MIKAVDIAGNVVTAIIKVKKSHRILLLIGIITFIIGGLIILSITALRRGKSVETILVSINGYGRASLSDIRTFLWYDEAKSILNILPENAYIEIIDDFVIVKGRRTKKKTHVKIRIYKDMSFKISGIEK